MNGMLAIHQREAGDEGSPWLIESGRRRAGRELGARLKAVEEGLCQHPGVRRERANASDGDLEGVLAELHDPDYLEALSALEFDPVVLPRFTAPGMAPDVPVSRALYVLAREGARTAITAAQRVAGGAPYVYALCRPPGHHAGSSWFGGYCYLNNAASATLMLLARGAKHVGILDLDLHYPNGTSEIVSRIASSSLHSLHAWPVTNAPEDPVQPRTERELLVAFRTPPDEDRYVAAVAGALESIAREADVLVLSLGYDTVAGDPHGSWDLTPAVFTRIGRLIARSGLPVCVVQEGGYSPRRLAACSHAFAVGLLEEEGS